jgi:hypothetical protein
VLFCEGEVTQSKYGGERLRLRRRIEAPIGNCEIRISDTVENLTDWVSRHALLYHFNLGYPAIGPGTEVKVGVRRVLGPIAFPDASDQCESTDHPVDQQSDARCSVRTPQLNGAMFGIDFAFGAATLPCLQIWTDLRPHAGVLAVEPCTSRKRGAGNSQPGRELLAGERRTYSVSLSMSGFGLRRGRRVNLVDPLGRNKKTM